MESFGAEMLPMEGTGFRLRRKWGAPGQSVEIGLKNLRYTGRSFQLTTLPEAAIWGCFSSFLSLIRCRERAIFAVGSVVFVWSSYPL